MSRPEIASKNVVHRFSQSPRELCEKIIVKYEAENKHFAFQRRFLSTNRFTLANEKEEIKHKSEIRLEAKAFCFNHPIKEIYLMAPQPSHWSKQLKEIFIRQRF